MIKVSIDRENCISCGMCWATCPDVYEENQTDEKSQVVLSRQTDQNPAAGLVEEDLAECAREGADVCPVGVIVVE